MFNWIKISHLEKWTCGHFITPPKNDFQVKSIETDSRTLASGSVFLALRGETFDGHQFLNEAIEKGASLLISEKPVECQIPVLVVEDTLKALVEIAKNIRLAFKGKVIAVTGSAGKSSTKDMIATLLSLNTVKSPMSFNNLIGVSKTMFLIEDGTENLVLEMGMNQKGEIRELSEIFKPQFGLITNIGDAHIGKLGGQKEIYQAKKELFDFLSHKSSCLGVAVSQDHPLVKEAYQETLSHALTKTYSANGMSADVMIKNQKVSERKGFLSIEMVIDGKVNPIELPIFGLHHAENIAAAVTMALLLGITKEQCLSRIHKIKPALHRGEIHVLKDFTLIDESYNSNPSALKSSLMTLTKISPTHRKVMILGDMLELGDFSKSLHREAGQFFFEQFHLAPYLLIAVGPWMKEFISQIQGSKDACLHFDKWEGVTSILPSLLKAGDFIFIKGSRGIKLDRAVEFLIKKYSR